MTRILLVDDKEDNLYLLRAMLIGHGYTVDTAGQGAEALVKARQVAPQLVVSDLLMPVMDGYTLLRYWKADERLRRVPFVVYTATYTDPADERLALDLGADAFIIKPTEPEPLLERIEKVLADAAVGKPGREPTGAATDGDYSQIVIRKLEEKTLQLTEANRALAEELDARKRAEEARAKAEAQLRQAQRMEALGTLAGGIAHDFNNMLAAILGNVELARQDVDPNHPAQESLAEVAKAGARARDLVQQILTFSRQQTQERHVIGLREVIEESMKLLRATLPAGVELATSLAPDTPNVLGDRTQIHQVLMNLCANAWQAIEGPTGRIEVSLASVTARREEGCGRTDLRPGRYARLSVSDTGRGMDEATVGRIFDPFFTTKPPGEGTGLGLAVVDGIVKAHGGTVTVHSVPGQGTTFRLYFPAVEGEAEGPRAALAGLVRGHGERILYLDDEQSLVFLATRLLGRLGYQVKGFSTAAEALAAIRTDGAQFDLFVLDLNMPGASGLDVAKEILRRQTDARVALTSGYVTDALRAKASALGLREVIYKPNTVDELAAVIGRLLASQGPPAS